MIVGAGPAGLTAAWHLARMGKDVVVLEEDPQRVGGLATTFDLRGHHYDVGPHRFYTKSDAIKATWVTMLPERFVEVRRLTRIYYEKQFFAYPLALADTLRKMGFVRSTRAIASFLRAKVRPRSDERSFEDWIVNWFGFELYRTFFKTYTEKVWGIPCARINKDWAAQRIRGLSVLQILRNALLPRRDATVKTLIDRFDYPRLGAGQLWSAVRDEIVARGGRVLLGKSAARFVHDGSRITAIVCADGSVHDGTHFVFTTTLKRFVNALDPPPPAPILAAGNALHHRDFLIAAIVVPKHGLFPDQWIYVHDPDVRVARISNPANFSAAMSPGDTTVLVMEYFCDRGDEIWNRPDADILALASDELRRISLTQESGTFDGRVHRFGDAYPVYDDEYLRHKDTLKHYIAQHLTNASPAGRKGLHNYNSQDHAMMTGTLAVRNLTEGAHVDVWSVNTDEEYAEEGGARAELEERLVPRRIAAP